jgi:glucosamine 6-phosphate synthetase-like amidotransferase/phosphosugar isomerase protein
MCGINGLVMLNGVERSAEMLKNIKFVFNELMVQTQERGTDATGLVHFKRSGGYDFYKQAIKAQAMTTNDEYYNQIVDGIGNDTHSVIAHTRWGTKGKKENLNNNHPFDIGSVVGVHNGTIANDDYLFKQYEKEFTRIAEVDSEIIYQLINHYNKDEITYEGLKKALEDTRLRGLFALAFTHKNQPNLVHIVKQEKPLNLAYWAEAGVLIFNSQDDFIENAFDALTRAGRTFGFTTVATVEYTTLKDDIYFTIDSSATDVEQMLSDVQRLYIASSATKTYTGGAWNGKKDCGTDTGCTTSTSTRSVNAKDSIGRIIEGELDEITGEIILFTSAQIAGADEEDVEEITFEICEECQEILEDGEENASYNSNNPSGSKVCGNCYAEAIASVLA